MNRHERLAAALRGQRPDRVPVTAWGHDFLAEWSPRELADSTVRRAQRYDWDVVKLQPRASCFAEAFGSDYGPSGSALEGPRLAAGPIREVESWSALPQVDAAHPALADQVEALSHVLEQLDGERPVWQTVFSPFTVASYLAADERAEATRKRPDLIAKDQARAVQHLREAPERLGGAMAAIGGTLVDFVRRSLVAGAHGIFFAVGGAASADALSRAEYEELLLPHDLAVLDSIPEDVPVVLHVCGPNLNFDLVDRFPVAAVSWAATLPSNPGLAEGRDRSGLTVLGGVHELDDLANGSPGDVGAAVAAAVDETGGAGLIVGPGCSVPPATPDANLAALAVTSSTA